MKKAGERFVYSIRIAGGFVILITICFIINKLLGINPGAWGIFPWRINWLSGIITSPLSHGSFRHLLSNATPLLMLLTMLFYFYRRIAWTSFIFIYIFSGLAVWLLADSEVIHVGASGVVYGLISFIFWAGIFNPNLRTVVLTLVIIILYSGAIYGVLPNDERISWESHLYGGFVGIIAAWMFRDRLEEFKEEPELDEVEEPPETYFFDRDTFGDQEDYK